MADVKSRLDEILSIFQDRLAGTATIQVDEPFASDDPPGVGAPIRSLTLLINPQLFALFGLTVQAVSPQSPGFVAYLSRRARARKSPYIALTNQRDALLIATPIRDGDELSILRVYPSLSWIGQNLTDPLSVPERNALIELADKIAADILTLQRDGQLDLVIPDSDFFVERLTRAVDVLKPAVKGALQTKIGMDIHFANQLEEWAVLQGIPADLRSPDFAEAVTRQAIYRLLGKIIFYQSLRRAAPHLPELNVFGLDTSEVLPRLRGCFAHAHEIDYHAVFREDLIDNLPFPSAASNELCHLVEDLNTRDFAHLPQDVIGAVFERLIPKEDRHALGQFFTPEPLADLIIGFCVRNAEEKVLDPTCGTGTFLIRAYNRLQTALGVHDHSRLLGQLWGVDIAPFPAELATINLFRQQVEDAGNFPRVLNEDLFQIIPGGRYRFPPLKADLPTPALVDEPIPQFDAIVGNFPYISAERIEQVQKGYLKNIIYRRLADEWFKNYPGGFYFSKKGTQREFELAREKGLPLEEYQSKAEPDVSIYSDFYAYLFWHAAAFLKLGGRMGIVTSNAWLDVGFGYGLQRFFLNNFKIVAILESRCEPWFEQAAVNTVVTILERCESAKERDAHTARFVKIKRRLDKLIPWEIHLDALNRWNGIGKLVQRIEAVWQASDDTENPYTWEDNDFRVRSVRQAVLRSQLERRRQTVKWGRYLRAPQVYFDLLIKAGEKLVILGEIAPPSRGSLTGINEFYYLTDEKIKEWKLEPEFLLPLLKSPGETSDIIINENELRMKVFVCRLTIDELNKQGKVNSVRYIEWGEKQVFTSGNQAGLTWPHGAEVRNRKPGWYALPEYRGRYAQLFFAQAYGDRYIQKYISKPIIADARLYFLSPKNSDIEDMAAIMNSSFAAFFTEIAGRVTMGDGALELKVKDARDYLLVPDPRKFDETNQLTIRVAFQPLLQRPIGSVFDEIQRPDRQTLDRAILAAIGLDADTWLPRIYEGLTTLMRERVQLGQMRSQTRKSKPQKAARRVAEEVLQDILPDGPQRFPDGFLSPAAQAGAFHDISLPVQYIGPLIDKEEMRAQDGHHFTVANKFEVRFLLYCQTSGYSTACIPNQPVEVSRTVNNYVHYLRDLRDRLRQTYFKRTFDQAAAYRFVEETWRNFNLPDPEE